MIHSMAIGRSADPEGGGGWVRSNPRPFEGDCFLLFLNF